MCQVCGLKWSHDDRELASGGNDNQVCVSLRVIDYRALDKHVELFFNQ